MPSILSISGRAALLLAAVGALAACDSQNGQAAPKADAPHAANTKDWTQTVVETAEGGYRMGNPDAKVSLIEYGSFTCAHCRDFHLEGHEQIELMVRTGRLSYEYRPFLLNLQDMAATLMATCEGPGRFFTWTNELYVGHDTWLEPFIRMTEADVAPVKAMAPDQQLKGLAIAGNMHEFARARGLPRGAFEQCLSDQNKVKALTDRQKAALDKWHIEGTPTFILDGEKVEGVANWAGLEPKLRAALQ